MIVISRVEEFSTLLALKKDVVTLQCVSSIANYHCLFYYPKILLCPQKIFVWSWCFWFNLKWQKKISFYFCIWKVLWNGHRCSKGNSASRGRIEIEFISGKKFNPVSTMNNKQVAIVPCKYKHLFTYISTSLVWWWRLIKKESSVTFILRVVLDLYKITGEEFDFYL